MITIQNSATKFSKNRQLDALRPRAAGRLDTSSNCFHIGCKLQGGRSRGWPSRCLRPSATFYLVLSSSSFVAFLFFWLLGYGGSANLDGHERPRKCGGGPAPCLSEALHVQSRRPCVRNVYNWPLSFLNHISPYSSVQPFLFVVRLSFSQNAQFTMAGSDSKPKTRPSKIK